MRIAIVGTGYVGLVTGASLAKIGHQVTCVDVLSERVAQIRRGEAPFYEPGLAELLAEVVASGNLKATTSIEEAMQGAELSMIAVGTPAQEEGIDLSAVVAAAGRLGGCLKQAAAYHVVVVKSTVVPGTTATVVRRELEAASGQRVGDFGLCMNPEFLREGSAVEDFLVPDRIIIGQSDPRAGAVVAELYARFDCPVVHTSLPNAEMIKYTSNTLLSSLISFSNEIAGLCERVPGCDVDDVLTAVQLDRRWSPRIDGRIVRPGILEYLRAGSGYGGSCFPKDIHALRMFARQLGAPAPLLDAVTEVNVRRPRELLARMEQWLGPLRGQTIAAIGLAFKPGSDDLRCSPALEIIRCLDESGAVVRAFDPVAMPAAAKLQTPKFTLCRTPEELLSGADAAVITTAWPEIAQWDWTSLAPRMRRACVVDLRNACRKMSWPIGLRYLPIGVTAIDPTDSTRGDL